MSALGEVVSLAHLTITAIEEGKRLLSGSTEIIDEVAASLTEIFGGSADEGVGLAVGRVETTRTELAESATLLDMVTTSLLGYLDSIGATGFDSPTAHTQGGMSSVSTQKPGTWLHKSAAEHVDDRGSEIGRTPIVKARNHVREVATERELTCLFRALSSGATPVDKPGYPGSLVRHSDHTTVGYRTRSKTSPYPTLDISTAQGGRIKIHINGDQWGKRA